MKKNNYGAVFGKNERRENAAYPYRETFPRLGCRSFGAIYTVKFRLRENTRGTAEFTAPKLNSVSNAVGNDLNDFKISGE
ncbi:MAG: hypothetical protein Q4G08_05400 [Capnocytophaga sp.]|nr:hypothetical protein [Capnocytophaga sp.]